MIAQNPTLNIRCPTCNAGIGHCCRMSGGYTSSTCHVARRKAYLALLRTQPKQGIPPGSTHA